MNKSVITNLIAAILVVSGYLLAQPIIFSVGLFALSGAVTNWLAVHMLFEKVPGLYGSGVIPTRFEEFKTGIANLMMKQFFTDENIDRFLSAESVESHINLQPVIEKIDLAPAFDALVTTVEQSSLGSMLAMFGGSEAITPLREPFIEKMKLSLVDISQSEDFINLVKSELERPDVLDDMRTKVNEIVTQRLNELTPELVKDIIQEMIREHLGGLVVWGGVFGGVIGLIAAMLNI